MDGWIRKYSVLLLTLYSLCLTTSSSVEHAVRVGRGRSDHLVCLPTWAAKGNL